MKQEPVVLKSSSTKSFTIRRIVIEIITTILLIVWLHTGISKLIDWRSFSMQMQQSPIFHSYANIVTFAGPIVEIILSGLLIFNRTRMLGMVGSFLLMAFFSWYVCWLMLYLPTLPCSCGGIVSFLNWPQHLALNIFLMIASLVGVLMLKRQGRTA